MSKFFNLSKWLVLIAMISFQMIGEAYAYKVTVKNETGETIRVIVSYTGSLQKPRKKTLSTNQKENMSPDRWHAIACISSVTVHGTGDHAYKTSTKKKLAICEPAKLVIKLGSDGYYRVKGAWGGTYKICNNGVGGGVGPVCWGGAAAD